MIIITRPVEGVQALTRVLNSYSIPFIVCPVLRIREIKDPPIPSFSFQAVILTSIYSISCFQGLPIKPISLFVVGDRICHSLSFKGNLYSSPDGYKGLLPLLEKYLDPYGGGVLYLSGQDITYDFSAHLKGLPFYRVICYRAEQAQALPALGRAYLRKNKIKGVTFFSTRTLHTFCSLALPFVENFSKITAYCLSNKIAEVAKTWGFKTILTSPQPTVQSMATLMGDTYDYQPTPY